MDARQIINAFGGCAELQRALGNGPDGKPKYHFSTIFHWFEKNEIPEHRNPLADVKVAAKAKGIDLSQ